MNYPEQRPHQPGQILSITMHFATHRVELKTTQGETRAYPMQLPDAGHIQSAQYFPNDELVEFTTDEEEISIQLSPRQNHSNPILVYLDQNHWIDFAKWWKRPEMLSNEKIRFFDLLAESAENGDVMLPLSSAHFSESSKRGGESRLHLAGTMLRFSQGWQMRSVLGLRRAELRQLFGGSSIPKAEVVSLMPNAAFDTPSNKGSTSAIRVQVDRLVWATTIVALLLDEAPIASDGQEIASNWAASFPILAKELRVNPKAKARSRDVTRIRFFSDLGEDLPAAAKESGMNAETFGTWLANAAEKEVSLLPGVGRLRETFHLKLANADEKWEANDLNDLLHLSFAAGYFDLVVGEKKTINHLKRVQRLVPPGAGLHSRAQDALPALEHLIHVRSENQ